MNKCIILTVIIFSLTTLNVIAEDFTYNINYSDLPTEIIEPISIRYLDNKTLNITYGNFTSSNITFLNFSNNETLQTINVLINLSKSIGMINFTDYILLYNIEDEFNSNISFKINIIDNRNLTNMTEYVQTDFNSYEYTMCDYGLPWNRTKSIVIKGSRPGQTIYTDADSNWIDVPTSFVIPDSNETTLNVNLKVSNVTPGEYNKILNFSVVSDYSYINFTFVVQQCIRPAPSYDDMVLVCAIINKTPEQQLQCSKLQAEYQQELYESMLSTQKKYTIVNETVKYVNVTERVPVLDLNDNEVAQSIKDLPVMVKQLITDSNNKQKQIDEQAQQILSLRDGYINSLNDVQNKTTEQLAVIIAENQNKQLMIDEYEEKYIKKGKIWFWSIFGLVIIGVIIFIIKWNEDRLW